MTQLILEEVVKYLTEVCKFKLAEVELVLDSGDQGIIRQG